MSSYQRPYDKRKGLQDQYNLLKEKFEDLRRELAIQADPMVRFQLKNQVKQVELEWDELADQLDKLDTGLNDDHLHKSLLKLNYHEQVRAFRIFVEGNHPIGAFLIHGESDYGQTWLLSRLVRQHFQSTTAEKIRIDLRRHGRRRGIDTLWRELSSRVGLKSSATPQDITNRVVRWCKDRHVVLIFDEINLIEPYFEEFITSFWYLLVNKARNTMPNTSNFRLIMFLIDSCGLLSTHNSIYDDYRDPQFPVRLPPIVQLSADALLNWMQHEADALPIDLTEQSERIIQDILRNSENGIPELVLREICDRCGCDWYEREHIWLKI